MSAEHSFRVVSYHDTWMSLDPIKGCPYQCSYCILRAHEGRVGVRPQAIIPETECVRQLLEHPLFVPAFTPIAIGNETDFFYEHNVDYLVRLLTELAKADVANPIILITKAPLTDERVAELRRAGKLRIIFFLSYSGLGRKYEPNFADEQLRNNFAVVARQGIPIVHYWRPLLPENAGTDAVRRMLAFVSGVAQASVLVGLKLHPALTSRLMAEGRIDIPLALRGQHGEWIEEAAVRRIHEEGARLCANYPLYRHAACALAKVLQSSTLTGAVFRDDICPPSRCPAKQRSVCGRARRIASEEQILTALHRLGRPITFERQPNCVQFHGVVTQEEFAFLLHQLHCPIKVERVEMQRLYYGSIFEGQVLESKNGLLEES